MDLKYGRINPFQADYIPHVEKLRVYGGIGSS